MLPQVWFYVRNSVTRRAVSRDDQFFPAAMSLPFADGERSLEDG